MPDEIDRLVAMMPNAKSAETVSANRLPDLTAIVGVPAIADEYGWTALRETIEQYGGDAESYRMTFQGDRYLIQVWFAHAGNAAKSEWQRRLDTFEI